MTTNILTIKFTNEISPYEVSFFRGAIINSLDEKLLLFHDHDGDKLRYGYPLIQYKRIEGRAAIVCLGEGTEQVWALFESGNFDIRIGQRRTRLQVDSFNHEDFDTAVVEKPCYQYKISNWLPFNKENFDAWRNEDSLMERVAKLESILCGNILSMLKGIGVRIDGRLKVVIKNVDEHGSVEFKHVQLASYDVNFAANIALPANIGLGKHTSVGYGVVGRNK